MDKNAKIFVVDDNERICRMFQIVLREEGIAVDYVLNGQDAIKKLKTEQYDFVFQDAIMPGMGGIETIEKIRDFNKDIKIVLITGCFLKDNILDKVKQFNVLTILKKPITISQVISVVRSGTNTIKEDIPQ